MDKELKQIAKKQYLHYFCVWFIIVGFFLVALAFFAGRSMLQSDGGVTRGNTSASTERVFDNADILTSEEEDALRTYIAKIEEKYHADFVILTISQPVEGSDARDIYGYDSTDWEHNMMDIADAFWDENGFGYNKSFEGDGSLLLDNRYEGQRGEWLSTSGKVESELSSWDVDDVLTAVDKYYDTNPYKAYVAYIDAVCARIGAGERGIMGENLGTYAIFAVSIWVIAVIAYLVMHMNYAKAKDDVRSLTYVPGGQPEVYVRRDDFLRKEVITRHISSNSGGSGGGGGHHTSHSGASHGGGGHRH